MAYTAGPFDMAHLYLQWGGKLPGGEQWSCGMRLAGSSPTGNADAIAALPAMTTAIAKFHTSINAQISNRCLLSEVKLNEIGTNGHYIEATTNTQVVADTPGGATTVPAFPNQVALAVSLLTGFSRGPAHRGRFYVPMPCYPVQADGLIRTQDVGAMETQLASLISEINAASGNWKLAVFSRKLGGAAHRPITGTAVGRAYDTQRRRRRSLPELYV